jgi:hypothetical protein
MSNAPLRIGIEVLPRGEVNINREWFEQLR